MSTIWGTLAAIDFGIQWGGFGLAYLFKTEKFYDVTGSLTYLTLIAATVENKRLMSISQKVQLGLMALWTVRLGSFLLIRILKDGEDRRFREIKENTLRFFGAWTIQGMWVLVTMYPSLRMATSSQMLPVGWLNIVGWSIFGFGFLVEVVADYQKLIFRSNAVIKDSFIQTGLWAWSRHPNYLGEISLWMGMCVSSWSHLTSPQARLLTALSPGLIALLILRVSGVPMLEASAERRWGDLPAYQRYKTNTACLVPFIW